MLPAPAGAAAFGAAAAGAAALLGVLHGAPPSDSISRS